MKTGMMKEKGQPDAKPQGFCKNKTLANETLQLSVSCINVYDFFSAQDGMGDI